MEKVPLISFEVILRNCRLSAFTILFHCVLISRLPAFSYPSSVLLTCTLLPSNQRRSKNKYRAKHGWDFFYVSQLSIYVTEDFRRPTMQIPRETYAGMFAMIRTSTRQSAKSNPLAVSKLAFTSLESGIRIAMTRAPY